MPVDSPVCETSNPLNVSHVKNVRLPKKGVLDMNLILIWWWGSSSGNLESVKYTFIAITPRFTQIRSASTCKG